MSVKFDPTIELNPNPILAMVLLLVVAGFGIVYVIVSTGDVKPEAAAPAAVQ
ncbi:hypothetical protein [Enhygromyxa salina]|uniref:Uncharacterized protein n=1 Tax=Enhygromyxa salina TaxID=215803 RepID=A0A2S9Y7Q7_9BACT|nr:hypothetical protein [Enhygromyxa salina]PRQ01148.1 hypothetical protein ENSA7_57530 [Enhygromyxa salina]